jgi:hypothetical protein
VKEPNEAERRRIRDLFSHPGPLYDEVLRRRTLEAVNSNTESRDRRLAWVVAPVAALALMVSFALPAWLLSIPIMKVVESQLLALALGLFIVHVAGVLPAGLCTVLALRHRERDGRLEEVFHE